MSTYNKKWWKAAKAILGLVLTAAVLAVGYFVPFQMNGSCGESGLCRVRFGVYTCGFNSEGGPGGHLGSDLYLYEKVGGIAAYVGLQEVDCGGAVKAP